MDRTHATPQSQRLPVNSQGYQEARNKRRQSRPLADRGKKRKKERKRSSLLTRALHPTCISTYPYREGHGLQSNLFYSFITIVIISLIVRCLLRVENNVRCELSPLLSPPLPPSHLRNICFVKHCHKDIYAIGIVQYSTIYVQDLNLGSSRTASCSKHH